MDNSPKHTKFQFVKYNNSEIMILRNNEGTSLATDNAIWSAWAIVNRKLDFEVIRYIS